MIIPIMVEMFSKITFIKESPNEWVSLLECGRQANSAGLPYEHCSHG